MARGGEPSSGKSADVRLRMLIASAAIALAPHGVAQAQVQAQAAPVAEVMIGVIDTKPSSTATLNGVSVEYRGFGMNGYGEGVEQVTAAKTHGDLVLDSIRDARSAIGDERSYRVLHANPFVDNQGRLGINYGALSKIVDWYHDNGVKVISTTFAASKEDPRMAAFVKKANDSGMVVVTSVGNGGMDGVPFPAANPATVAIDGVNYKASFTRHTDAFRRADAVFSGATGVKAAERMDDSLTIRVKAGGDNGAHEVVGSSFAVPRAAVMIASRLRQDQGLEDARAMVVAAAPRGTLVDLSRLPKAAPAVTRSDPAVASAGDPPRPAPGARMAMMAGMLSRQR